MDGTGPAGCCEMGLVKKGPNEFRKVAAETKRTGRRNGKLRLNDTAEQTERSVSLYLVTCINLLTVEYSFENLSLYTRRSQTMNCTGQTLLERGHNIF